MGTGWVSVRSGLDRSGHILLYWIENCNLHVFEVFSGEMFTIPVITTGGQDHCHIMMETQMLKQKMVNIILNLIYIFTWYIITCV